MKKRFGIDIDDICAGFIPFFLKRLNYPTVNMEHPRIETWFSMYDEEERENYIERANDIIFDHNTYRKLLPVPNAAKVLHLLENEVDIFYITSRYSTIKRIAQITHDWLLKFSFPYAKNIYLVDRENETKFDVAKNLNLDFLLDDVADNVKPFGEKGGVINYPWNQKFEVQKRFVNWHHFYIWVSTKIL